MRALTAIGVPVQHAAVTRLGAKSSRELDVRAPSERQMHVSLPIPSLNPENRPLRHVTRTYGRRPARDDKAREDSEYGVRMREGRQEEVHPLQGSGEHRLVSVQARLRGLGLLLINRMKWLGRRLPESPCHIR